MKNTELAQRCARVLKALANAERFLIVERLLRGESGLPELCELTGSSQSMLSQNLTILRKLGLVNVRGEQQYRFYTVRGSEEEVLRAVHDIAAQYAERVRTINPRSRSRHTPGI